MTTEGRALSFFAQLRERVAEVDRKIAAVTAYRDRLIATRDRKHQQIALSEREWQMHQHKIDAAEAQLLRLVMERSQIDGSPIKAPFQEREK